MDAENTLWKGNSSQWLNLWPFTAALLVAAGIIVGCALTMPLGLPFLAALVLPVGYMLWKFLMVRTQIYELTTERLRITRGVINQRVEEIELYRVKDSQLFRSWWMRLAGLASVQLETSDRGMPTLVIPAIHGGMAMRELLRRQVEIQRDMKRVREMDFDEVGDGGAGH